MLLVSMRRKKCLQFEFAYIVHIVMKFLWSAIDYAVKLSQVISLALTGDAIFHFYCNQNTGSWSANDKSVT